MVLYAKNLFQNISTLYFRPFPHGNHGLCPTFYNFAFNHTFLAVDKDKTCRQPVNERDALQFGNKTVIRMGYYQKTDLNGVNFYAITSRDPPFN